MDEETEVLLGRFIVTLIQHKHNNDRHEVAMALGRACKDAGLVFKNVNTFDFEEIDL